MSFASNDIKSYGDLCFQYLRDHSSHVQKEKKENKTQMSINPYVTDNILCALQEDLKWNVKGYFFSNAQM